MRVKTGTTRKNRHKKVLKATKGMRLAYGTRYKASHEAFLHQGQYQYVGRKLRKRDLRRLWIQRINAGLSQIDNAPSYSVFMHLLKKHNVILDRKVLADMVTNDLETFKQVVSKVYSN